jgi:hypothetical protein
MLFLTMTVSLTINIVTCDTGFVELSSISAIIRMRTSPVIYKNCRNGGRDGSTLTATQKVLRVG